jgi:hypothetical protein
MTGVWNDPGYPLICIIFRWWRAEDLHSWSSQGSSCWGRTLLHYIAPDPPDMFPPAPPETINQLTLRSKQSSVNFKVKTIWIGSPHPLHRKRVFPPQGEHTLACGKGVRGANSERVPWGVPCVHHCLVTIYCILTAISELQFFHKWLRAY